MYRENQDLEQNRIQMEMQTAAIQKEKEAFQQEALDLAQRLDAVIHDKFIPKSHIDADTPIDKTLNFLHAFVVVRNSHYTHHTTHLLVTDHMVVTPQPELGLTLIYEGDCGAWL